MGDPVRKLKEISEEQATKTCHYCAETILVEAKICRFCQQNQTNENPTEQGDSNKSIMRYAAVAIGTVILTVTIQQIIPRDNRTNAGASNSSSESEAIPNQQPFNSSQSKSIKYLKAKQSELIDTPVLLYGKIAVSDYFNYVCLSAKRMLANWLGDSACSHCPVKKSADIVSPVESVCVFSEISFQMFV